MTAHHFDPAHNGAAAEADPYNLAEAQLITDTQGVIRQANATAAALLGTRRELLIDKPLPLLVGEARRAAFYALLLRLRHKGGGTRDWPARVRLGRGPGVEVLFRATVVPGSADGSVVIHWGLREGDLLAEARCALHFERELSDSLLHAARALVLVLAPDGRVLRANPYLLQVLGRQEAGVVGRPWDELLAAEDRAPAGRDLAAALRGEGPADYSGAMPAPSGEPVWVAWSATPLVDPDGRLSSVLLVGQDMTELHRAQQKALQAERLAAIGQVVTSLTHEARNLLQRAHSALAVLGWHLTGQEEPTRLVGRAELAVVELTRLFEDVRGFAAPIRLDRAPTHLGRVWREVWSEVCEERPDRVAALQEEVAAGLDLWCHADPRRVGQAFRVLIENAFEACPGPVQVEVRYGEAAVAGRLGLRVAVRDNGPGLSDEQSRRAAEPFFTTKPHGTGLGMTIAARIMEAHGGQLEISPAGPPGAEVVLFFPRN